MKIYDLSGNVLLALGNVDLREADLHGANLHKADLRKADLHGADLREADLYKADLHGANLHKANLHKADLHGADLRKADLYKADLHGADLCKADLRKADLREADLYKADLHGVLVSNTVLDPENSPSGAGPEFARDAAQPTTHVIGYRTREAGHIDQYRNGRVYSADIFSTCPETECHPGLYLWPTFEMAMRWVGGRGEIISVKTRVEDVHQAGGKWRCRWFEVIGGQWFEL